MRLAELVAEGSSLSSPRGSFFSYW